jgi:pyrrolidone-carboxylate peptidase
MKMSTELHPSIVALVSLAANIAANHPKQGLCQMDKLKQYGVAQEQIAAVVEIARHIRDEAGDSLDASFDEACRKEGAKATLSAIPVAAGVCCTPTKSGQSCC